MWPQLSVVEAEACALMVKAFANLLSIFVEHASESAFNLVPGHSYFLEKDEEVGKQALKTNVQPLLEEYLAQGFRGWIFGANPRLFAVDRQFVIIC